MDTPLLNLLDTGTKSYGYGGAGRREIKQVYRHTWTMPQFADYVAELSPSADKSILRLAREGWREDMTEAMNVCDRAVKLVETEMEVFNPMNNVTGMAVDIAAAVAGMPEDMIDFPLMTEVNLDRVITLCADVQCLAVVSDRAVRRRGYVIAGLAMALNAAGYQTNFWVADEYWCYDRPEEKLVIRTLVKGPNDMIDPARIMFAYAHEGVQRELGFAVARHEKGRDGKYGSALIKAGLGAVTTTTKDIPNCVYLPPIHRESDSPNADEEIRRLLVQIGLIPGEDD